MTKEQIIETWAKVFPYSHINVQTGILGSNTLYVNAFIAANKNEVSNKIWLNDILSYFFSIEVNNKYEEVSLRIYCICIVFYPYKAFNRFVGVFIVRGGLRLTNTFSPPYS